MSGKVFFALLLWTLFVFMSGAFSHEGDLKRSLEQQGYYEGFRGNYSANVVSCELIVE